SSSPWGRTRNCRTRTCGSFSTPSSSSSRTTRLAHRQQRGGKNVTLPSAFSDSTSLLDGKSQHAAIGEASDQLAAPPRQGGHVLRQLLLCLDRAIPINDSESPPPVRDCHFPAAGCRELDDAVGPFLFLRRGDGYFILRRHQVLPRLFRLLRGQRLTPGY